jgi:hypothetical protein
MPVCEFGERQYELAANLELLAGSGSFFAPTTSVEEHLAIDVALTPGDRRVWSMLGVPAPRGVRAEPQSMPQWPGSAPAGASPRFLMSLFVQYKRSTYLTRATAREWTTHQAPYWRVELTSHQHEKLQDIEASVGRHAVVRYAAPKFWRHSEMWQLQGAGSVLDSSLFVSPSEVDRRHGRLTWSPAEGLVGHSKQEPLPAEDAGTFARVVVDRGRAPRGHARLEGPREHLELVAAAAAELAPSRRRRDELREEISARSDLEELVGSPEAVEPLADMALIAEVANAAQATWLLVAVTERDG